jgi:hypothetical protein
VYAAVLNFAGGLYGETFIFLTPTPGLGGPAVHSGTATRPSGEVVTFDGMWSSSLTASASKGKPDIETVDTSQRLSLVQDSLDVSTKPLIYDADTGWLARILVDPLCP